MTRTAALLALFFAACTGSADADAGPPRDAPDRDVYVPPRPPTCAEIMPVDGGVADAGDAGFATGLAFGVTVGDEDSTFSSVGRPWHDGDTVTLVHGFQGGWMVTPSVDIDTTAPVPTNPAGYACFDLAVTNAVTGATVNPAFATGALGKPVPGRPNVFHVIGLFDLLSFDPADVEGRAVTTGFHVVGRTGDGRASVTVTPLQPDAGP